MAKQGKKIAAKLAARIAEWNTLSDKVDNKNSKSPKGEFFMRKPGSMKKNK
jgi:hypothetical protein